MCFENILAVVMLSTVLLTNTYAAGEPVNEDLSLLFMLSDELVDMGKQHDSVGFIEFVDMALKLASDNRNNSLILPRASAKFRAAKYAIKEGHFNEGIVAVEEAKSILLRKRTLKWDGGS
jgi:hypothetical protein